MKRPHLPTGVLGRQTPPPPRYATGSTQVNYEKSHTNVLQICQGTLRRIITSISRIAAMLYAWTVNYLNLKKCRFL